MGAPDWPRTQKRIAITLPTAARFLDLYQDRQGDPEIWVGSTLDVVAGEVLNVEFSLPRERFVTDVSGRVRWRRLTSMPGLLPGFGLGVDQSSRASCDVLVRLARGEKLVLSKREASRIRVQVPIQYRARGQWHMADTENISATGCFFRGVNAPRVGQSVTVKLEPPGWPAMEIEARVIWRRADYAPGVGVRFDSPDAGMVEQILHFVEVLQKEATL